MTNRFRRIVTIAAVSVAAIALAGPGAAVAQEVPAVPVPPAPTLPVPEPPEEARPALDAFAPLTSAVCQLVGFGPGTVTGALSYTALAQSLAQAYSPVPLPAAPVPVETYSYLSISGQACRAFPNAQEISECTTDRQLDGALNTVYAETGAGVGLVFVATPTIRVGPVLDTLVAVEQLLLEHGAPMPASPAAQAYAALECEDILAGVGTVPGGVPDAQLPGDKVTAAGPDAAVGAPTPGSAASTPAGGPAPVVGSIGSGVDTGTASQVLGTGAGTADTETATPVVSGPSDADRWPMWRIAAILAALLALVALFVADRSGWLQR